MSNSNLIETNETIMISSSMIKELQGKKGGYSNALIELLKSKFGESKGFTKWLPGHRIDTVLWERMKECKPKKVKKPKVKKSPKPLFHPKHNDLWKPNPGDIPAKITGVNKGKRTKISGLTDKSFYTSKEWRALRVRVLEKYECKCMMCGESPKVHGIVIHVDHIKPRSKFPHLALEFNNLQLLCEACNLGKGNKYQTDWRPTSV